MPGRDTHAVENTKPRCSGHVHDHNSKNEGAIGKLIASLQLAYTRGACARGHVDKLGTVKAAAVSVHVAVHAGAAIARLLHKCIASLQHEWLEHARTAPGGHIYLAVVRVGGQPCKPFPIAWLGCRWLVAADTGGGGANRTCSRPRREGC